MLKSNETKTNLQTAAVCGLFCPACGVYQATVENDTPRLETIAKRLNQTVAETRCLGCRSDVLSLHCRECQFVSCARSKNINFCGACADFPCDPLKEFQQKAPHRAELWQNQARIADAGWEKWFEEMKQHYACGACQTLNGAYDQKCRQCGQVPANNFTRNNPLTNS